MSIYKRIVGVAGAFALAVGIAAGAVELVVGVNTLWPDRTEDVVVIQNVDKAKDTQPEARSGDLEYGEATTRLREGETIEKLRQRNAVRALRATEEDAMLSTLPNGVYGYAGAGFVGLYVERDSFDELKLRKSDRGTHYVEVHKSSKGEVFVIVYATEGDVTGLVDPTRNEAKEMFVLYRPDSEYEHLVAIPASRLLSWDDRSGDELGYFAKIRVQ